MSDKKVDRMTLAEQSAAQAVAKTTGFEKMLEGTVAGEIWNEIKDKQIEMFALPDQKLSKYARPYPIEPTKLYLVTTASAALPAIETAIGKKYTVELVDKYVVVSHAITPLTRK